MARRGTIASPHGRCLASLGVGPYDRAGSVRIPLLLVVPEADSIAPVPAALEISRKAPGAELFRSTGGHYDVYEGGAGFADLDRARRSTSFIVMRRPQSR